MAYSRGVMSEERALELLAQECAQAEKCKHDMREKCRKWGLSRDVADRIVARLEKEGFVDDRRYAPVFVRDKVRFGGWGPMKIRVQLAQKEIDEDVVEDAIEAMDKEEWRSILGRAVAAKVRSASKDDQNKLYARVMRFGLSRGYSYDEVKRAYMDCQHE